MANTRYNAIPKAGRDLQCGILKQIHSYNNVGVLLGYWFEKRTRSDEETKELLHKFSRNEMTFQKVDHYINALSVPVRLTTNLDGFLHHGDVIRLKCTSENGKKFFLSALPMKVTSDGMFSGHCMALGTEDDRILARSAFHVFRNDNNVPNYIPLKFGERIQICTIESTGHLLLHCELKTFSSFAKQSKHQEVTWEKDMSIRTLWQTYDGDRRDRKRTVGHYIPANIDIVLSHLATGQFLALEKDTSVSTTFGYEKEVTGHTYLDTYKNEGSENKWQFEACKAEESALGEPIKFPPY